MHILEVEITTRCNLDCLHCYNRNHKNIDLPLGKIKEFYNFANKNKVWTFIISGGEAILHPKFDEFVSFVKKNPHSFRLVLQSNGILLDDKIIEKIRVFDVIHISFDLTSDVRKQGSGNFKLAKKLVKKGLNCYLFVTVHKKNRHLIDTMLDLAEKNKIPIGFNICIPVEKLDKNLLMSRTEFMETEKKLVHLFKENKILRYSSPLTALFDRSKSGTWQGIRGGCSAGVAACVINSSGELYPCPFFRLSAGNIFKIPLEKLWNESDVFNKIRKRREFNEPCNSCEYLSYCGGCRNRAFIKSGNVQGKDPMCYKSEMLF